MEQKKDNGVALKKVGESSKKKNDDNSSSDDEDDVDDWQFYGPDFIEPGEDSAKKSVSKNLISAVQKFIVSWILLQGISGEFVS